jgi:ribonucleoside-diphosphate reductase alpha chain
MTRPEILPAWVERLKTGYGHIYLIVSELNSQPFEVFVIIGKGGQTLQSFAEALGRFMTKHFRGGGDVEDAVDQLKGIKDDSPIATKNGLQESIPDAIGQALERRYLCDR